MNKKSIAAFFHKHREITVYITVGLMTTALSYGIRFPVLYFGAAAFSVDLLATVGDAAAKASVLRTAAVTLGWVGGMFFAFFANKTWVFRDRVSGRGALCQFGRFVLSRVGTYFVEWAIGVFVPLMLTSFGWDGVKLIINITPDLAATAVSVVTVTVLNYIISKMLVFKK